MVLYQAMPLIHTQLLDNTFGSVCFVCWYPCYPWPRVHVCPDFMTIRVEDCLPVIVRVSSP